MIHLSYKGGITNSKGNFIFGLIACLIVASGILFQKIVPGFIDTDVGIFSAVALKNLTQGGLYITAWENKPPALIYLMQLLFALGFSKVYALFFLAFITQLVIVLLIYLMAYKAFNNMFYAIGFTLVFSFVTLRDVFIGDGLYTEIFGSAVIIGSIYFAFFSNYKKRIILSYLLVGISFWFKEPFVFTAFILCLLYFYYHRKAAYFLWFFVPTIFFILLLSINGSLDGYINTIKYNFGYINAEVNISEGNKMLIFTRYFSDIVYPIIIAYIIIAIKLLRTQREWIPTLLVVMIPIVSASFVWMSPHHFGHYYLPAVLLFFASFLVLLNLYTQHGYTLTLWLVILVGYFCFEEINNNINTSLKWEWKEYKPDNITKRLLSNPDKTLFIDYVNRSDYYIKGNKVPITFLPVPLAVHFQDNPQGIANRNRIWKEISTNPPFFLITDSTTSYCYWHLPHNNFYLKNYKKVDSIPINSNNSVYLWQLK